MIFTERELAYIAAQRLGRLATIQPSGAPQVNPASCYYNPATGTIDAAMNWDMERASSLFILSSRRLMSFCSAP